MFKKLSKALASVATGALVLSSIVVLGIAPAYAAVAPSAGVLATARATILAQTNAARAAGGLPPLVVNPTLDNLAQSCSQTQAINQNMAHCADWASYPAGFSWAGENVAAYYTYNTVVNGWINSPPHYASIMKASATDIGIGYYLDDQGNTYFTQNFGAYPRATGAVAAKNSVGVGVDGVKVVIQKGTCGSNGTAVWESTTATTQWASGAFGISLAPGTYCATATNVPASYLVPAPVTFAATAPGPVWVTLWLSNGTS